MKWLNYLLNYPDYHLTHTNLIKYLGFFKPFNNLLTTKFAKDQWKKCAIKLF